MRNLASCSAMIGIVLAAAPAFADSYDVKFEEISSNCANRVNYPVRGSIKIEIKGADLQVDIDRVPLMVGKVAKAGKISAKSPRPGHTPIEGMDGVFSVAGRITDDGMVSLVMVGEYQKAGRPVCTQSWNLSGLKKK